jgi:hypothetical protein
MIIGEKVMPYRIFAVQLLIFALLSVTLLTAAVSTTARAEPGKPDPNEIVAKADAIRFPTYGFQVDIDVTTLEEDETVGDIRRYRILSKGNDRTLVNTTAPASEKGQL